MKGEVRKKGEGAGEKLLGRPLDHSGGGEEGRRWVALDSGFRDSIARRDLRAWRWGVSRSWRGSNKAEGDTEPTNISPSGGAMTGLSWAGRAASGELGELGSAGTNNMVGVKVGPSRRFIRLPDSDLGVGDNNDGEKHPR